MPQLNCLAIALALTFIFLSENGTWAQNVVRIQGSLRTLPSRMGDAVPVPQPAVSSNTTSDETESPEEVKTRLQKLDELVLSRTPSQIFEAWAKANQSDVKSDDGTASGDLPPAPRDAIVKSDERFAQWSLEFQFAFLVGDWRQVGELMEILPQESHEALLTKILVALVQDAPVDELARLRAQTQNRGVDERAAEKQYASFNDVLAIVEMSKHRPIKKELLASAASVFAAIIARGNSQADLIERLTQETQRPESERFIDSRSAARLLASCDLIEASSKFLPEVAQAESENDVEALNMLAVSFLRDYDKTKKNETLEKAWYASLAVLSKAKIDKEQTELALTRIVSLSKDVRAELGKAWLVNSFSKDNDRGVEIMTAIGKQASAALLNHSQEPETRLELLKLQNQAVKALFDAGTVDVGKWKVALELLALNWLRESTITYTDDTSTSRTPMMRRDMYGNYFYYDDAYGQYGQTLTSPIKTGDLLEARPDEKWLAEIDTTLRPKFDMVFAQLFLKVGEEQNAFPYIERLAEPYPKIAEDLVKEFLQVWTTSHDPNSERRNSYYSYMYGYESRAESIPLTRSKQQRNLQELSDLLPRLKAMKVGELDQRLLANAFLICHSYAEVFKVEDIERVFGPFEQIDPKAIYTLAERMRSNLASVWRDTETQKQAKTKRSKKDVEAEVKRGYQVAQSLIERSLASHPDDWALWLGLASLQHDQNNYLSESTSRTEFSADRKKAFETFAKAAELYLQAVPTLDEGKLSTEVYESWYYAALGSVDLALVDEKQTLAPNEPTKIREAILALPGDKAEWHLSRFANLLFSRMNGARPAIKSRYLDAGFEIVGDHPQAREARDVHQYYRDLVTEIKLEMVIDGDANVGEKPFGFFVNIVHTKEIERESGGFGKYLQNQNQGGMYYYNYGRPLEDYRDKFEEYVRDALSENFEVESVTFQVMDVKSRPAAEEGWRITPYAYVLAKTKGPQVDKIPPVKIDFDFLDTSGYAILPIESPALPIDSRNFSSRPYHDLKITQILDERNAHVQKLMIEVKASAKGLAPDLSEILGDLKFDQFDVVSVEDQNLSVSRFEPETTSNEIVSERAWIIQLAGKANLEKLPEVFAFVPPIVPASETIYQRYKDADIVEASLTVNLNEKFGTEIPAWRRYAGSVGLAAAGVLGLVVVVLLGRKLLTVPNVVEHQQNLTPFAVIAALREVEVNNGLSEKKKVELAQTIRELEGYYFANPNSRPVPAPRESLETLAKRWLNRA